MIDGVRRQSHLKQFCGGPEEQSAMVNYYKSLFLSFSKINRSAIRKLMREVTVI